MRRRRVAVVGAGAVALSLVLTSCLTQAAGPPVVDARRQPVRSESTADAGPAGAATRPAPTRWEEARATEVLLAQPRLGALVRRSYAAAAGRPLTSPAELRVHSLIFRRHGCELHRCLQLFVRFPDGRWLDVGRVIADLTTGELRVLNW
ncbi:hypothetical protein Skr01_20000 [Sphaerisporangium krabiense]|uniref:Lipoprotein n=1 Tax=Sphaerisporangium krabiense TaxID=763782 RepID=A0A7W9DQP3_9ACTN|nr:hypothetical protein [Sphaerisporangium krabiense]MBB5627757.1 hypothetical protein [Sphaerisporangium krabiense]GII61915.1 hypothetical protein Skr01_20000 [Sphaerisporangium krabiense]